jgi:hypothetical protein
MAMKCTAVETGKTRDYFVEHTHFRVTTSQATSQVPDAY